MVLTFPTIKDRLYNVQYTNDLATGVYQTFTGDIIGTGSAMTITDDGQPTGGKAARTFLSSAGSFALSLSFPPYMQPPPFVLPRLGRVSWLFLILATPAWLSAPPAGGPLQRVATRGAVTAALTTGNAWHIPDDSTDLNGTHMRNPEFEVGQHHVGHRLHRRAEVQRTPMAPPTRPAARLYLKTASCHHMDRRVARVRQRQTATTSIGKLPTRFPPPTGTARMMSSNIISH